MATLVGLPSRAGLSTLEKIAIIEPYSQSERENMLAMKAYYDRLDRKREELLAYYERRRERVSDLWWMVRERVMYGAWARGLIQGYKRAAARVRDRMASTPPQLSRRVKRQRAGGVCLSDASERGGRGNARR